MTLILSSDMTVMPSSDMALFAKVSLEHDIMTWYPVTKDSMVDDDAQENYEGGDHMGKNNESVRKAMRVHDVKQWQLAEAMNMAEATLCRKLRTELSSEIQKEMLAKIKEIAAKKESV